MKHVIDAVYERGTFRAVQPVRIPDGQRVRILVDDEWEPEALELATSVYDGLSAGDIAEIERIALDRRSFFGPGSGD